MKCEVIIIENDFSGQVDKVQLDSFSADIKAVLLKRKITILLGLKS